MSRRGFQGLLAGVAALIGLAWIWSSSVQAGLGEHEAFTANVRELQRLEHSVRLDVLRTRMGLLQTYDPLVRDETELHATYAALFPLPSFLNREDREEISIDLAAHGALLERERDLVERFKTRFAVLRNSLRYLPTLSAELVEAAGEEPDGDRVARAARAALEEVLLFNLRTTHDAARVEAALDDLSRAGEGASPALAERIALFDSHARTIARTDPEVDADVDALFLLDADGNEHRIGARYDAAIGVASRRALLAQSVLYVASIALVVLVVFAFYRLRRALSEVESLNATLEARVASRTAELDARTADLDARNGAMRRLLSQVAQGFATLGPSGAIPDERSAILERWLGPIPPGTTLFDLVRPFSADAAAKLEFGWSDLFEDVMPAEVVAEMLHSMVPVGDHTLEIAIQVPSTTPVTEVLLVVSDATARLARERAERDGRELAAVLERITRDPSGFRAYVAESEALVARVLGEGLSTTELLQDLHTLKGGSFQSGLEGIGHLVHELESAVLANGTLDEDGRARLGDAWLALTARFEPLIRGDALRLDVSHEDLEELARLVDSGAPRATLVAAVRSLEDEKLGVRLDRLGQQMRAEARRRAVPIDVHVEAPPLRLEPARWGGFFATLTHVVRNTIAHATEAPESRALRGKAAAMRVCFAAHLDGDDVILDITDDGAGIDWERVAAKASELGLPSDTRAELADALFVDRLTTAKSIDSRAGRGVGLSAVQRATRALGGTITIESERGLGTHFRFRIPRDSKASSQRAA